MVGLLVFFCLLVAGFIFGRAAEHRHYRSIVEREDRMRGILAIASKILPPDFRGQTTLVGGSVVIPIDYFKHFLATLRNLFGGHISSYETLLEQARREAVLRMKARAADRGANMVFNVKIETASISKGSKGGIVRWRCWPTALP